MDIGYIPDFALGQPGQRGQRNAGEHCGGHFDSSRVMAASAETEKNVDWRGR
jgi:hypothetical protein